jgi:hypothetical protein
VRCEVAGALDGGGPEDLQYVVTLAKCPSCADPIVAYEENLGIEQGTTGLMQQTWSRPSRLWPSPILSLSGSIPQAIRDSMEEASTCLQAGAYTAAVAMIGRALEGMCRHYQTRSQYLGGGLPELHERGIIDHRLYEWGKELRLYRNTAAHADPEVISRDEAQDLMEFATAILGYVFVLSDKFDDFLQRKSTKKVRGTTTGDEIG